MKISILIATYGDEGWRDLAWSHAYPSALGQDAHEILVRHEEKASIAQVRNDLAKDASGDWLLFLDADDELAPGCVARIVSAQRQLGEDDRVIYLPATTYVAANGARRAPGFQARSDIENTNYLVIGSVLHRDLFLEVGGFSDYPHGFEDWSLWAKCLRAGARVVRVRDAVYVAHVRNDSVRRRMWKNRKWQSDTHHRVRRELFPELYEDLLQR